MGYPISQYEPRERENWPNAVYNPAKKSVLFKEDADNWDNEVAAIENELLNVIFYDDFIRSAIKIHDLASGPLDKNTETSYTIQDAVIARVEKTLLQEVNGVLRFSPSLGSTAPVDSILTQNNLKFYRPQRSLVFKTRIRKSPLTPDAIIRIGLFGADLQTWFGFKYKPAISSNFYTESSDSIGVEEEDTGVGFDDDTFFDLMFVCTYQDIGGVAIQQVDFYIDNVLRTTHKNFLKLTEDFALYFHMHTDNIPEMSFYIDIDYFKITQNRE